MKHTPGPWAISNSPDADTGGKHIYNSETGDGICGLWAGWSINDDTQDANSHLIAAAPDLLDACQALYDHFLTTGGKEDSLLGMQVKEALKKALGV